MELAITAAALWALGALLTCLALFLDPQGFSSSHWPVLAAFSWIGFLFWLFEKFSEIEK